MRSTPRAISSNGKYWHRPNWYHTVVACWEICESLTRIGIGFLKNALCHLQSSEHILSQWWLTYKIHASSLWTKDRSLHATGVSEWRVRYSRPRRRSQPIPFRMDVPSDLSPAPAVSCKVGPSSLYLSRTTQYHKLQSITGQGLRKKLNWEKGKLHCG